MNGFKTREEARAAVVGKFIEENGAARRAAADPLPGPLSDAFSIKPDIEVGKWKVRPFVDRDFEFLKALSHPFDKMMKDEMEGIQANSDYKPIGHHAWELCWIMTRPTKEVKELFKSGGLQAVKDSAENEFGDQQVGALLAINTAVIRQMAIYWSTAQQYGPASKEGEKSLDPTQSLEPSQTVSDGSSKSVVGC